MVKIRLGVAADELYSDSQISFFEKFICYDFKKSKKGERKNDDKCNEHGPIITIVPFTTKLRKNPLPTQCVSIQKRFIYLIKEPWQKSCQDSLNASVYRTAASDMKLSDVCRKLD